MAPLPPRSGEAAGKGEAHRARSSKYITSGFPSNGPGAPARRRPPGGCYGCTYRRSACRRSCMCARPTLTTASLSPDRLLATTGSWQARACSSIRRCYPIRGARARWRSSCRILSFVEMLPVDRGRRRGRKSGHGTPSFRNFSRAPRSSPARGAGPRGRAVASHPISGAGQGRERLDGIQERRCRNRATTPACGGSTICALASAGKAERGDDPFRAGAGPGIRLSTHPDRADRRYSRAHLGWVLPEPLLQKPGARYRLTWRRGIAGQPGGVSVAPASPGGEGAAPGR